MDQQESKGPELDPRILIVDDNEAIHSDFNKILGSQNSDSESFKDAKAAFFGLKETPEESFQEFNYQIDSALQGKQALEMVIESLEQNYPYTLAFVDMRMPPGWDGLETVQKIWEKDPEIQIVFCSAYSDHSWEQYHKNLNYTDRFLILKKPFDHLEVKQLAASLTKRWQIIQSLTGNQNGCSFHQSKENSEVNREEAGLNQLKMTSETGDTLQQLIAPLDFLNDHLMASLKSLDDLESLNECFGELVSEKNLLDASECINQLHAMNPESLINSLKHSIQGSVLGLHKIQQIIEEVQNKDAGQYRSELNTVKST